jgi:hypothetical protein
MRIQASGQHKKNRQRSQSFADLEHIHFGQRKHLAAFKPGWQACAAAR